MDEMTNWRFQGRIVYDLASYKELAKATTLRSGRNTAAKLLSMGLLLLLALFYGVLLHETAFLSFLLILYLGIFWGGILLHTLRSKDGDLTFKRIISANSGTPPRNEICFCEDSIHTKNLDSGGFATIPYSHLRKVYDSENFLIFFQEHRLYFAIRKDSITGGTAEELLDFVFRKGTLIKKKKLISPLPGKIVSVSLIIFTVLSLLFAIWSSYPVQFFIHSQRQINNYMSYSAIAEELETLGITGIDDAVIEELEAYDWGYDYTYSSGIGSKAFDLLCREGMGEYDEDTWEWTPSDSGVYWFDMEVMSPDVMYTEFLTGVQALSPEALDFTDIVEDLSQVNYEDGCGTQRVSFSWNGNPHMLEAIVDYDWFDLYAAADLADIVKAENTGKQLYFAFDGGQGVLVFYNTPQWCKAFEKATGIPLTDDPRSF